MTRLFYRSCLHLGLAAAIWSASAAMSLPTAAATFPVVAEITSANSAAQDGQISRGEIVVHMVNHHPIYHFDVYGVVDAPPEEVWEAVTSYDRYQEFLPLVVESGVRRRTSRAIYQYVRMRPPWPLHDHWMVNANVEHKSRWNISWTMADGNLKLNHGYWQLVPLTGGRTRMQYHLTVDPWLDLVPGWLVEFAVKQVMPNVVKGVRRRVQDDAQAGR